MCVYFLDKILIYAYIFFNIFDFLRAYFYPIYNDNSPYPLKKNTVTEPEYIFSLYIYILYIYLSHSHHFKKYIRPP